MKPEIPASRGRLLAVRKGGVEPVDVFKSDAAALDDAVEGFFGDMDRKTRLLLEQLIEIAQQRAAALEDRLFALLAQDGQTLRFEPPMPPESVRRLADAMVRANGARCAVFAGQDGAWHYAMADRDGDLRGLTKRLNAALQGRGGGREANFMQGSLRSARAEIAAFWEAAANN